MNKPDTNNSPVTDKDMEELDEALEDLADTVQETADYIATIAKCLWIIAGAGILAFVVSLLLAK